MITCNITVYVTVIQLTLFLPSKTKVQLQNDFAVVILMLEDPPGNPEK